MDQNQIRLLKIIEAFEKDGPQSQRELSRELDISLGLVNALIRNAVKNGLLKHTTTTPKRTKYSLTSKGITEKAILKGRYIAYLVDHYNHIRTKLDDLIESLAIDEKIRIVLYGANALAEIATMLIQEHQLNLVAIVDDKKVGKNMHGVPIVASDTLKDHHFDALVITEMNADHKVMDAILSFGVAQNQIHFV